ncbi:MAG: helix-turn-helix transcriptional regulator [Oscillospiraceae bacterium]|nr:helix-turn-helix transcriptional regulator [Oscillospiraceae bacterium]
MTFTDRLIAARKAKGLSQEALAEALGLSRQAVSKWETGESKPDLDNLIGLCRHLQLSMEYLCLGTQPEPASNKPETGRAPQKRLFRIAIGLLCAIAIFLSGMLLGNVLADSSPLAAQQRHEQLLQSIQIVNASVIYDQVSESYTLNTLLSSVPEGLSMELLLENKNFPSAQTLSCQPNELQFSASLQDVIHRSTYDISAVITLENTKRVLPLISLEFDTEYHTFHMIELWRD